MRPKTPPFQPNETKEEREQKLRDFILAAIDGKAMGRDNAVIVLARSPDSPVMRALLSVSGELAARGAGAAIILAGGAIAAEDETWNIVFSANFVHEIRLTTNPRVLDGHEQIVVGDAAVWYGDTMRRDPWTRDAFATFLAGEASARQARATFARLWASAHSIYANPKLDAVIVSATRSISADPIEPSITVETGASVPAVEATAAGNAVCATIETLEAWQPSTCH